MLVQQAIKESGLPRAQIARDAGVDPATVWAWLKPTSASGRAPRATSVQKLARGLRRRGEKLIAWAERLEREAGE